MAITDSAHTASQSFQYDALNRLIKATGNYGTKEYAYDPIGNLIYKEGITYTYGEGREKGTDPKRGQSGDQEGEKEYY